MPKGTAEQSVYFWILWRLIEHQSSSIKGGFTILDHTKDMFCFDIFYKLFFQSATMIPSNALPFFFFSLKRSTLFLFSLIFFNIHQNIVDMDVLLQTAV